MIAVVGRRKHKGQKDMESVDNNLQLEDILEKNTILIFIHINQLNSKNFTKIRNCVIGNIQYMP